MSANFIIRLNSSQLRESKHQTQSGVVSRELPAHPTAAPATMIMTINLIVGIGKSYLQSLFFLFLTWQGGF